MITAVYEPYLDIRWSEIEFVRAENIDSDDVHTSSPWQIHEPSAPGKCTVSRAGTNERSTT